MTSQITLTLIITLVAIILFATEKLRVDLVALLVLLTLTLTGLISPDEAFSGFSNPAVITVWAVYIVSGGLFKTGVADIIGGRIIRLAGSSEPRLILMIMLACGLMSAFMNNIGATAILLPAVVSISHQAKVPLSRLLIPLSFSSLMGGNMTLIGTPPNILGSSILVERGLPGFGFFDFTPIGMLVFATGILYMLLLGRHLIPVRKSAEELQTARLREYTSEVRVLSSSPLVGRTLVESRLGEDYDLNILAILRDPRSPVPLHPDTRLRSGDLLLVEGSIENLMKVRDQLDLALEPETKPELAVLKTDRDHIVEAILAPRSRIAGRSLRELNFRDRYGFSALAIWRQGEVITQRLRDVKLNFGDTLLLQGPREHLSWFQDGEDFILLEQVDLDLRRRSKIPYALGSLALVLALVTMAKFPISTAMVIGAVAMVLTRCLSMDEAYQSIEWRSVFLIAGMLPLGIAMEATGTAAYLAGLLIASIGSFGPLAVLGGIYVLAGLVTEPMSNAAATVLIAPIAIDVALGLGANPQSFVLAVVIGASTSFLTPIGHQANLLVYGPGGYRFTDFMRVGGLLNLFLLIVTLIFLPRLWPLF
jgi:di/tricarboxylate transporter